MTVRQGLLAILTQGSCHGYQLKQEFEARTGGGWPLKVAQVYSTLDRLARDGFVEEAGERDDGSQLYRLTDAGRKQVEQWLYAPGLSDIVAEKDDLPTKIALAFSLPGVDIAAAVQAHRRAAMVRLQELTALMRDEHRSSVPDLGWELTLDAAVFAMKSRVQWLDHAEAKINRARQDPEALAYGLRENRRRRGRPRSPMVDEGLGR